MHTTFGLVRVVLNAAEQLAVARHFAIHPSWQQRTAKVASATKRLPADWDDTDSLAIRGHSYFRKTRLGHRNKQISIQSALL